MLAKNAGTRTSGSKQQIADALTGHSPFAVFAAALKKGEAERVRGWRDRLIEIGGGRAVVRRETVTVTQKNGSKQVTVTETWNTPAWQAFAWLLERTQPDDYGRRDRVEPVDTSDTGDPAGMLEAGEQRITLIQGGKR